MHRKFDFGPQGEPSGGCVRVTDESVYDPELGYGFTDISQVTAIARDGLDDYRRDFCIPYETSFVADVPNGSYVVTIWMGDAEFPTSTTLRAGGGRLFFRNRTTAAGLFAQEMFAVNVRLGQLKLTFSGPAPRINMLEIAPAPQQLTLFLAGDSTVTDQKEGGYPYAGWGQMLSLFLKHDVAVANHAHSGRSSRSFIDEGRLDAIFQDMKAGDWLFIQFGHNDQKQGDRYTDPETTYPEYLLRYINGARERGAFPVLVTSMHRRYFNEDETLRDTHGAYPDAVRKLAAEAAVPLIDLAERGRALFEELGEEGTKQVFMWGAPGEFLNFPAGIQDNTHFQERGAIMLARLVAEEIKRQGLWPLSMYLKNV